MQLINFFTLLAIMGYANAECYDSGLDFDNQDTAASIAMAACQQTLSGTYGPESTYNGIRGSCVNTGNGKIDFLIEHITDGDRDLGVNECYDGLQKEINNCGKGGNTSYDNWSYKYASSSNILQVYSLLSSYV